MRMWTGLAAAAVLLLPLAACGETDEPSTLTVRGTVTVFGGSSDVLTTQNNECRNDNGSYDDINQGARAVLKTDAGKTLGIDSLTLGSPDDAGCRFGFLFQNVPDADFYTVTIAGRDPFTFKRSEADNVRLQIGS